MAELQTQFAKAKGKRVQLRRIATLAFDAMKELYKEQDPDKQKIEEKFVVVADRTERLFKADEEVSELIFLMNLEEKEISEEFDMVEQYRERWLGLCHQREKLNFNLPAKVQGDNTDSDSSSSTVIRKKRYLKLFKLEPKKFDGKLQNWLGFWAMYQAIHDDPDMDPGDKFQYLLELTLEGSPARELLNSFPATAQNYEKAVKQLKGRFGRLELLIELYVRELLKLVLMQATGTGPNLSLRSLYDRLETQLRSLESLGVTKDHYQNMLLPLVESSLPDDVLRQWERERSSVSRLEETSDSVSRAEKDARLDLLLKFLRKEVESEERLELARDTFSTQRPEVGAPKNKNSKQEPTKDVPPSNKEQFGFGQSGNFEANRSRVSSGIPTAAGLVSIDTGAKGDTCIFCSGTSHKAESCFSSYSMQISDIKDKLKEKGHCFLCFKRGHPQNRCRAYVKCLICLKRHNSLLCDQRKKIPDPGEPSNTVQHNLTNFHSGPVLLQTLRVRCMGDSNFEVRMLIDCGSQQSYATRQLIQKLGYKPQRTEELVHALFGGQISSPQQHKCYKLFLANLNDTCRCNFDVLDAETICQAVPTPGSGVWHTELEAKGIVLSDHGEGPIDVLVGADVAGKLWTGRREVLACGLIAIETLLGWTLMGKLDKCDMRPRSVVDMVCFGASPSDLWRLDLLGIEDPIEKATREERAIAARDHFLKTVRVQQDGRYEVQLPWVEDHPPLPRNFEIAAKRLDATLRKLQSTTSVDDYAAVFNDWLENGIIEEIPFEEWDTGHYLPHRPVFKEGSTTRIRPVFDASCHTKGLPSLNHCLEKGLNLIELIFSMLLRFRKKKFGVIGDIAKAFLQIALALSDRDFLRFVWRRSVEEKFRIFRHKRVVFGVSTSPFLLASVIEHLLRQMEGLIKTGQKEYSLDVVEQLLESFYVDNVVTSLSSVEEIRRFIEEATSIFAEACFDLRGWEYSDPALEEGTATSVLGIVWDRKTDTLTLNLGVFDSLLTEGVTRRSLMSATQRLFDPIGIASPTILIPRLLVQRTWAEGGGWDTPVEEETASAFRSWVREVSAMRDMKLRRCFEGYLEPGAEVSLHTFCDASQDAYAAVMFMRVERRGKVELHLVGARSRVAPLKRISIPRLELLAAALGARLAHSTLKELTTDNCYYWSDSTTVLAWVQREEPWNIFVFNRVSEIRQLSEKDRWFHVPGMVNPADLLSRGCNPTRLMESKWWEGPHWLRGPVSEWPMQSAPRADEEAIQAEKRKTVVSAISNESSVFCSKNLDRFSRYHRIVRLVAWMIRFLFNKLSKKLNYSGHLSIAELDRAEKLILKVIQDEAFDGREDHKLKKLKPRLDESGLIRLRTKIWARRDAEDFRAPFILPMEHVLADKIVMEAHIRNGHAVGQGLLSAMRERFWVLRGRQAVRRVASKCLPCKRIYAKALDADTPPLPENRVRDAQVFEICGTDFAGPLYLRNGDKVWICIITCAVYRAIYLDLVTSLTTEAFMLAFRRFVSRHGRPSIIYSDNGTNFRGLNNLLHHIDWEEVSKRSSVDRIEWRFNPPTASWWGGFWERLIGIVKVILKKILGRASLTFDELSTVTCECAAYVNSRPMTYVSEDPSDPVPITPQMFLSDIREVGVPDLDTIDAASFGKRVRRRIEAKENLRARFRTEYLGQLTLSMKNVKKVREPTVGELMLIGSDNKKRMDWPLAIVEEVIRGPDGKCRVLKLRTADGVITRPIQRVYPLEIPLFENTILKDANLDNDPQEDSNDAQTGDGSLSDPDDLPSQDIQRTRTVTENRPAETRCGRKVSIPVRFRDYVTTPKDDYD